MYFLDPLSSIHLKEYADNAMTAVHAGNGIQCDNAVNALFAHHADKAYTAKYATECVHAEYAKFAMRAKRSRHAYSVNYARRTMYARYARNAKQILHRHKWKIPEYHGKIIQLIS